MSDRAGLSFFVPGEPPRTAQARLRVFRNKAGRVFLGKTRHKGTEAFLARLTIEARKALALGVAGGRSGLGESRPRSTLPRRGKPASPVIPGPLAVSLEFSFPHPVSTPKFRKARDEWRVARPDLDNLAKSVLDALTRAGVFEDDSRVAQLSLSKFNSPKPGLRVAVATMPSVSDILSPPTK